MINPVKFSALSKIIAVVAVTIFLTATFSVSYVHAQTLNVSGTPVTNSSICANNILSSMYNQSLQVNHPNAISLASGNYQYQSKMSGYNSKFASIFETWSLDKVNCKAAPINIYVGYILSDHTGYVKNLVITLDPTLSKVTGAISYVGRYYSINIPSPNWSGYEVSANGGNNIQLTYSNVNYSLPGISQPPASANSNSCMYPSVGCDLAVWTGLEDAFSAADNNLAQSGSDGTMICTSIGTCTPANYFLWTEFLPAIAMDCFNSTITVGDPISATTSFTGGTYFASVVDNRINFACSNTQSSYPMTRPIYAPFINERAVPSSSSPHRDELAKFNPVQMTGGIGFGTTNSPITTSMIVSNDPMVNPYNSPSGTPNISNSDISNSIFTESWLSSDHTNTCYLLHLVDWHVSSNCALEGYYTADANVIIENNSVLTIPSSLSLTLNFTHHHLLVNHGSGVLIQSGGKIGN